VMCVCPSPWQLPHQAPPRQPVMSAGYRAPPLPTFENGAGDDDRLDMAGEGDRTFDAPGDDPPPPAYPPDVPPLPQEEPWPEAEPPLPEVCYPPPSPVFPAISSLQVVTPQ